MEDSVRPDAREAVDDLVRQGLAVEIVSGDRAAVVEGLASKLGVHEVSSGLLPGEKVARVASHDQADRKILMVGDGLNDAPALAAAHVSMAPATAADIGRNAADFVFLNESLSAVGDALGIARRSRTLIFQNFALAVGYNALAVPVAVLGYVTPLVAAVAMSLSSIIVVANALRLPSIPNGTVSPGAPRRNVMGSMWWLILIGLGMACAGLAAFLWSLRNGQYDDLDGAAERVLLEEDPGDKGRARQER